MRFHTILVVYLLVVKLQCTSSSYVTPNIAMKLFNHVTAPSMIFSSSTSTRTVTQRHQFNWRTHTIFKVYLKVVRLQCGSSSYGLPNMVMKDLNQVKVPSMSMHGNALFSVFSSKTSKRMLMHTNCLLRFCRALIKS